MDELEAALEVYGKEVTNATWSFFVWKHINNVASSNADIRHVMNQNALSWRVAVHSLQTTFIITLGRIFDNDGRSLSVETLLEMCKANLGMFGGDALRARKMATMNGDEPDWLNDYVRDAYTPTVDDIDNLLAQAQKEKELYREVYNPIRSKVMAHRDWASAFKVGELFEKTSIGQIQEILDFLFQVESVIWDLLYNGQLNEVGSYGFEEEDRVQKDVEELLGKLLNAPISD